VNMISSSLGVGVAGAIRVFVVDDSSLVRAAFSRLVTEEPGLELAGTAASAEDALNQLGSMHVQVVLLDLEMPGMGGMRALPEIIKRSGTAKVIVVSSLTAEGAEHTVQALSQGAADAMLKPAPGGFDQFYRDKLIQRIRSLGRRPLRRVVVPGEKPEPILVRRAFANTRAEVLAIGASTGGIHATGLVLSALPPQLGVPILVTQHLPAEFTRPYARQLSDISGREVDVARDGLVLQPDRIVLAPGDAHIVVARVGKRVVVRLDDSPSETGCIPSVDPMFASLARVYGSRVLGVVLTGMGRDGTEGAKAIVEAGGNVMVQNEASSAVWGMPGSVAKAGFAAAVLHPSDIALRIVACTKSV
jgi:two-component system, chemotaxis family, protein-glutamate methylesterase/glutaminase